MNKFGRAVIAQGYESRTSDTKTPSYYVKIFFWILGYILIGILILFIGFIIFRAFATGESSVAITHIETSIQEPKNLFLSMFYKNLPNNWYNLIFKGDAMQLAYETEVETNEQNRDLGVRITKFSPTKNVYLEGEPLVFSGIIQAKGVADSMVLEAYCDTDGLEVPVEGRILGNNADGNRAVVLKEQTIINPAVFNVQCEISTAGITLEKPKEGRKVDLIIVYEFSTRATQKVYFINSGTYNSLISQGKDPFDYYSIRDPQLGSDRRLRTKSTSAPLAIILGIDVPQPLTDSSSSSSNFYQLTAGLEPNVGWTGNLERLESFELQLPNVNDLNVVLEGESDYSALGSSSCGFEYVSSGDDGFKLYKLNDQKLAEINKDCSKRSLKGLAFSESDCIDLFKTRPSFLCNFKATHVPQSGLQYDTFRAEARYVYKITKPAAIEIRKRPDYVG